MKQIRQKWTRETPFTKITLPADGIIPAVIHGVEDGAGLHGEGMLRVNRHCILCRAGSTGCFQQGVKDILPVGSPSIPLLRSRWSKAGSG